MYKVEWDLLDSRIFRTVLNLLRCTAKMGHRFPFLLCCIICDTCLLCRTHWLERPLWYLLLHTLPLWIFLFWWREINIKLHFFTVSSKSTSLIYADCIWKVRINFGRDFHVPKREKVSISTCDPKHLFCVL